MPSGTDRGQQADGAGSTVARRVYVAGPLFSEAERAFNERLATALEGAGFSVYLPQRDAPPATEAGYARSIYDRNRKELRRADLVVAVCEGLRVDDGTAWEIGCAIARGTPVYGLRTDPRTVGSEERVNLMVEQSLSRLVESLPSLLEAVDGPERPRRQIDPDTEIASDFKVSQYHGVRPRLDHRNPDTQDWRDVLAAFWRRVEERFIGPIKALEDVDGPKLIPGFAILALDCLLIDTLQSFREGRVSRSDSDTRPFTAFLKSQRFKDGGFKSKDREDFVDYVRNGLLHNGETRGDWKVNLRRPVMLHKDLVTKTRTLNRKLFHAAVVEEFEEYFKELRDGVPEGRERFLRRMDAICGWEPSR